MRSRQQIPLHLIQFLPYSRMAFLHPKELRILRLLARGRSYEEVCAEMKIKKSCLHTHCLHIRQKTGIRETKDARQCKDYMLAHTAHPQQYWRPSPTSPTHTQLEILRLMVEGLSYAQIARERSISVQCVQDHASQGCLRAGIRNQGHNRTRAIQSYLVQLDALAAGRPSAPDLMDDPMF